MATQGHQSKKRNHNLLKGQIHVCMLVNTNSVTDMVDLNICMYVHSIIYVYTKQGYFLINLVTCIM